jgi:hypothetical protein
MTMSFFNENILSTVTTIYNRYHTRQNFCASDDGIHVLVLDTLINANRISSRGLLVRLGTEKSNLNYKILYLPVRKLTLLNYSLVSLVKEIRELLVYL